jgi:thiol:disulfide interchange protein DsbA
MVAMTAGVAAARRGMAIAVVPLLLWCLALPAGASPAAPEEGFDYDVVAPPAKRAAPPADGRVEVVEFFWYQCPHCNALTALIEPWAQRSRQRVRFVRLPLSFNTAYAAQDRLYFALEQLGEVDRLHPLVFQAIHEDGVKLKTVAQMSEFLRDEGVERARFEKAMRSPRVRANVAAARELASHYRIAEVPTLLVDGRYVTSAGHVGGSQADAITVVEWLVRRVEEERRAKPR